MKKISVKMNSFLPKTPAKFIEYQKSIAILIYLSLGVLFFFEGCRTLFENPYVCPPVQVVYQGDYIAYSLGIIQGMIHLFIDLSLTLILVGSSLLYASFNYEKSDFVDVTLFIFFSLSTFIHWIESFDEEREIHEPFMNGFSLFLIVTVIFLKIHERFESYD